MKSLLVTVLFSAMLAISSTAQLLEYVSPRPGSQSAPPSTLIIVRSSHDITGDAAALQRLVSVSGSSSIGSSPVRASVRRIDVVIHRASDGRTLNIIPSTPLQQLETIVVSIRRGYGLPDTSFRFVTTRTPAVRTATLQESEPLNVMKGIEDVQADTVPSDFPPINITTNSGATPMALYIAPNSRITPEKYGRFAMALDSAGVPRSHARLNFWPFDFKVLPNGLLAISKFSAVSPTEKIILVMDTTWTAVDSLEVRNGYTTSFHDHTVLPNGHIVVMGWENVIVDMSSVVSGGNPAASVLQGIIQELDQDRNVVFQWRSLDYIPVTDTYENMLANDIRYIHNNAISVEHTGDFIVSLRHCSSVIRIDRSTGELKWILGGKRNQFSFSSAVAGENDPLFSYQHDVRRTAGGITLFDNGNARSPQYSRAVEYLLDEVNKTAQLVWTYRHSPDIYTSLQGGVRTMENGHRLITWGSASANNQPSITEVDSNGTTVFEATMPKELFVNRAQRHPWPPGRPSDSVFIDEVLQLNTYNYADVNDTVGIEVTFTALTSTFYNATNGKRYPYAPVNPRFVGVAPNVYPLRIILEQEGITNSTLEVRFDLDVIGLPKTSGYEVYHRPQVGSGTFTKQTTQFTPDMRTLVVAGTDFGEFLIADAIEPTTIVLSPNGISPINSEKRLVGRTQALRIAPRGPFDSIQVQVAPEDGFSTVLGDWTTKDDKVSMTSGTDVAGTRYWRSRAYYDGQISEWSDVDTFELSAPYLTLDLPQDQILNKVITYVDSAVPILWNTNLSGYGRLVLIIDGQETLIKDSVRLENPGYLWKVALNTPIGTGYAIRITAITNGESDESDTIVEVRGTTSIDEEDEFVHAVNVAPNPATTSVAITGDAMTHVSNVLIFDAQGLLVGNVIGSGDTHQTLNVEALPPGTYHCMLMTPMRMLHISIVVAR